MVNKAFDLKAKAGFWPTLFIKEMNQQFLHDNQLNITKANIKGNSKKDPKAEES